MRHEDITKEIRARIRVSDYLENRATAFARAQTGSPMINTWDLVPAFCTAEDSPPPDTLDISTPESEQRAIDMWAAYASRYVAIVEATWRLIHEGHFLRTTAHVDTVPIQFSYRAGRSSGGLTPRPIEQMHLPQHVIVAPSRTLGRMRPAFIRPEELLSPIAEANAHTDVLEAAKDALKCFRARLFRPAIVLLGKAVEGAWTELCLSLAEGAGDTKTEAAIREGELHFRQIVRRCRSLYTRDQLALARKESGVSVPDLNETADWTDSVRAARNAIHFGVRPSVPNSYEKAAVMLLLAVEHLTRLYAVRQAISD